MLYLNENHLRTIGADWEALTDRIEEAARLLYARDYAQPIKPYLRYGSPKNRIIAMPAYVGGDIRAAGIKWIASFPDNLQIGLPRAHSVMVLNDADTGKPAAILNTPLTSIVRTASVSALMLRLYLQARPRKGLTVGIIGWGPIGRAHYDMCVKLFGDRIGTILLHDIRGIDRSSIVSVGADTSFLDRTEVCDSWQEVYEHSDIFFTCTVAERRYIDRKPKEGSLLLHVSLRDYLPEALAAVQTVIVDDWEEVCRENTDIEMLHKERGLVLGDTRSLAEVVCESAALADLDPAAPVLFSPMGMAVFDIAVADYYARRAKELGVGLELEE